MSELDPHTNPSGPGQGYDVGWFILKDPVHVLRIDTEKAVYEFARKNRLQIFWNRPSLESALNALGSTLPAGEI
jgi:hypothetical protein